MDYTRKTDEEVKRLAVDLHAGRIFCDRHLDQVEELGEVFVILALMDRPDLQSLHDMLGPQGMVYEYTDKAGPMAINGHPCFFSAKFLNSEDAERVLDKYRSIKEAVEAT